MCNSDYNIFLVGTQRRSFWPLDNVDKSTQFWRLSYPTRPEWTGTHQFTNVDGWCTFFVPPCTWVNLGGELKLTFFIFPFLSPGWFFLGTFFSLSPHTCPGLTYLPTFRLLAYVPWHPPSPTYLPTCPPTHPSIYLPTHLPTFPSNYLPMYLCTKFTPRQRRCSLMKVLQYIK